MCNIPKWILPLKNAHENQKEDIEERTFKKIICVIAIKKLQR